MTTEEKAACVKFGEMRTWEWLCHKSQPRAGGTPGGDASQPGLFTLVTKIIQLTSLEDITLTNLLIILHRQENTRAHQVQRWGGAGAQDLDPASLIPPRECRLVKTHSSHWPNSLFWHLFHFPFKEIISNSLLTGSSKVSLQRIHTTWSNEKAETTECYE